MSELVMVVQQGLGLAVVLALPVALAALVGAAVTGILAGFVGLQDQTVSLVGRAVSCVVAVVLMMSIMAAETRAATQSWWSRLAEVGRGSAE